ncbi:MAG: biotin-dependent carboxyltransferase family protein, partial [Pseudomonadota bacterium]
SGAAAASIQDGGRIGFGRFGVPRSGALDAVLLRLANTLVGAPPAQAAFEIRLQGPILQAVGGPIRLGLAGGLSAQRQDAGGAAIGAVDSWRSVLLHPGERLSVRAPKDLSVGYVAIAGGLALKPTLGGLSTYARAQLGVTGLADHDVIALRAASNPDPPDRRLPPPAVAPPATLRVMPGPQDDYFDGATMAAFFSQTYRVGSAIDRMGARLAGETPLRAKPDFGHDLTSDGLVPGAIQVPASGEPIILGVDCQTVGGYPKIATVIRADLHRIGRLRPNQPIRFTAVDRQHAARAWADLQAELRALEAQIVDSADSLDLRALYQANLIDGVVSAEIEK